MGMMGTMTTRNSKNDPYFVWLCNKAKIGEQFGKPYAKLASELHELIFRPNKRVPMDDNRTYDGFAMRVRFIERYGEVGSSTSRGACTMLEFLVGLAEKMSFLMGEEGRPSKTAEYFWYILVNLRLIKLTDDRFEELNGEFFVDEAVQRVLDRTYGADGDGGLFPLKRAGIDQRNVEIWYQMQSWLAEHCAIDIE